MTYKPL